MTFSVKNLNTWPECQARQMHANYVVLLHDLERSYSIGIVQIIAYLQIKTLPKSVSSSNVELLKPVLIFNDIWVIA